MHQQTKVTGVILAGGLARRMNGQDKGLIEFRGKPLIQYAIASIRPLAKQVFINANRNLDQYQHFGYPVITDQTNTFDGPLAGVLTALEKCQTEVLLVMPCDCPFIKSSHLEKLLTMKKNTDADITVAFDGKRMHPVFLALSADLSTSLKQFLAAGERKIDKWLVLHKIIEVDFSDTPDIFVNINTLEELQSLQQIKNE